MTAAYSGGSHAGAALPAAKLVAQLVEGGKKSTYLLYFPAPADDAGALCAEAKLILGSGEVVELGLLCPPTPTTWSNERTLVLKENVPVAADGQEATLVWGAQTLVAIVVDGEQLVVANQPTLALLNAWAVADKALETVVEVQVDDLPPGYRLRIDGGAGNQVVWTLTARQMPEARQTDAGLSNRGEWTFGYPKPGTYSLVVDLLDREGYWVEQLAAQPLEVQPPISDPDSAATAGQANSSADAGDMDTPAEIGAAALPAWEPFRYARPMWAWARTYTGAGGSVVSRSLALGTYLAIRQEVLVNGALWYQTGAYDWIPASSVVLITPSSLRGVELTGGGPGPDPDPDPDPEPDPDPDNLPKGLVTANVLNVRSGPGTGYSIVTQLRYNTRVTLYEQRLAAGATWYRIGNGWWVHGSWIRVISSDPNDPTPNRQGIVTADVLNVRAQPGVNADNPPVDRLARGTQVMIYEERLVASVTWYRIGVNRWVHGGWIRLVTASNDMPWVNDDPLVHQAEATATMSLPVGWVVTTSSNVRAEPSANATLVGTVVHNQSLAILEERTVLGQAWFRIGTNRWVYGANVRVARLRARPAAIRADERWVGVNLREQTVVAYLGDTPVYAALTATGMARTPTVQGIFRTWWRLISRRMAGGSPATGGYYYLEEVPWTLYFYSGYALHAAYWHDAFGNPRSHGCVNLSMYDAWWIFRWSEAGGANSPAVYVYWA